MRIAFYAPLKAPDHAVPSGDRAIARAFMAALRLAGHQVDLASDLRSWMAAPDQARRGNLMRAAQNQADALIARWRAAPETAPNLWFTYHLYYKAPDWIGPQAAGALGLPYVTAEASHAAKRDRDGWAAWQGDVAAALRQAALAICMTPADRDGLEALLGPDRLVMLAPFIDIQQTQTLDTVAFPPSLRRQTPLLITAAMMRAGDKLKSYKMLATALQGMQDLPWSLAIIGDGAERAAVEAAFASIAPDRVVFCGEARQEQVAAYLAQGDIYVWPGFGEAYGLAYLEAQLAGLPVVAQDTGGIASVVDHGRGGLLTPYGDVGAFRTALAGLITDKARRAAMGMAAQAFVREQRALEHASATLDRALKAIFAKTE